ncbi:MAG TPA: branched-chain amino acid ABC transporter substrate-binding protein [Burkholderiales bacterium]|nr:branched-chain amino acid ABC transporter substrate-binding protein [Burkholderiales bacterium]
MIRIARVAGMLLLAMHLQAAPAAEPLRVAFINTLSGAFALQGEETLKNVQAAVDMVNGRGGVLGRQIEIVPFDNKGNPQETLVVLKQAIDQDIRYVISGVSNIAHAITDAVAKHNARNPDQPVLFLDYGALDPALTEGKCGFWHFRFEAHADMQVAVLADYMARQPGVRKVYLINQDYAFGQATAKAAREMLAARRADIEIVGDELVPLGKVKDFAPYVAKIRASGADSVLTGNWGNDLSLLIKAGNETGLKATYYTLLGAFFGTPGAIGAAGADRVKTLYAYNINAAGAARQKLLLGYRDKYSALTNMTYLPAQRAVDMFAMAMEKAKADDPLKVALALEGMRYDGPSGESWMRAEDHQIIAPIYLLGFARVGTPGVKVEEEKTGYGWKTEALIEAKDTVPPVKCQMQRP